MGALTYADRRTAFFGQLRSASTRVLLLDYDGTLAPFQVERDRAVPYPEVPKLLGRINGNGTRVVLVSGRPARELLALCGMDPRPEIWGSHGMERLLRDGSYCSAPLSGEQETGLRKAAESVREQGLEERLEIKTSGVALHWRGLANAEAEEIRRRFRHLWRDLAHQCTLELLNFDGGLEIRVRGADKGTAVTAILRESNPDAAIAYLGDDRTDEDAFRVLQGKGLTVLVREQFRPTLADIQLRPPDELIEFLRQWITATEQGA
ncbi:MAG TPA: trehalose-phosphatase [Terriglobales bacterium]|nr:trehalose-phosphatase [Terriglobales bacterium]